jgi:diguanylate cyclase (GGDEF)-like protein/PAS domain S-box-containing protein
MLSSRSNWRQRHLPSWSRLALTGFALLFLSVVGESLTVESQAAGGDSIVWLTNGWLIGTLLCSPRSQWPAFFALGFLVDFGFNLSLSSLPAFGSCLVMAGCNSLEVAIAAFFIYPAIKESADLTRRRQLTALLLGGFLAPLVASSLVCFYFYHWQHFPFSRTLQLWFAGDVLGIVTVTPLCVSLHQGRKLSRRSAGETIGIFLLVGAGSLAVFYHEEYPYLWIVLLLLFLLGVRLGFSASAAALLLVLCIGGHYTVIGNPHFIGVHPPLPHRILVLQIFVATTMLVLYVAEVVVASGERLRESLQSSEARFRLLAESSRDIIAKSDLSGNLSYVSPAVTELAGWTPEEVTGQRIEACIHPDDIPVVQQHLAALHRGAVGKPITYRARHKNGEFLWWEANVRLFQNGGAIPMGYVYTIRDISTRKAAEAEQAQAFEAVERRATLDALTGVANRHTLDQTLEAEWAFALKHATPISMLLIDVDCFKKFNDCYGHVAGDECLRTTAQAIQTSVRREHDLLARYGGEEFLMILPGTTPQDALTLAEAVRRVVEGIAIPHVDSPHGLVTVSIGCASTVPEARMEPSELLRRADAALYTAKSIGRNRVHLAGQEEKVLA